MSEVRATIMNGWDVQPTLDWAIARSSGRIVRNRLIATPGPDPASPAAHLRALTVQTGQPVVVSTAACGGGPGGGPAHDGVRHPRRPWPGIDRGFAESPHIYIHYSTRQRRAPSTVRERARNDRSVVRAASGSPLLLNTGSEISRGNTH